MREYKNLIFVNNLQRSGNNLTVYKSDFEIVFTNPFKTTKQKLCFILKSAILE